MIRTTKEEFGAVIIDMQPELLNTVAEEDRLRLFESQEKILDICANNDYPIAVLEFRPSIYGETNNQISEMARKAPRHKFFKKASVDGYHEIKYQVNEWGLQNLIFMGIYAPFCVRSTALSAKSDGKRILTTPDLIANNKDNKNYFNEDIEWFIRNGTFFPKTKQLIDKIENYSLSFL